MASGSMMTRIFQPGQRRADLRLVREGVASGLKPCATVAVHLALVHVVEDLQHVVDLVQLGQPVVAPVVVLSGGIAKPGLHQTDMEFLVVLPVRHLVRTQGLAGTAVDVAAVVGLLVAGQ